ncbi:MAG: dUTP diphosphatase [Amylibacter sp.]|nr:dUTP diphosphatase [Amylibacter sp.]
MKKLCVQLAFLEGADLNVSLPSYETPQSAGMDLRANFPIEIRSIGINIEAGSRVLIPTGLTIAIPEGYEAQIRPRSGLALKHGVTVLNSPGTVDADYRGHLGIILINHSDNDFHILHGDRIAQIIFSPVIQAFWETVSELNETVRGIGGFGSTGRS